MALIGNYSVLAKQVSFKIGGQFSNDRSNTCRTGQMLNWGAKSDGTDWNKTAIPQGTGPGSAWLLPVVAGDMTAYSTARFSVTPVATGAMGFPIEGSAEVEFSGGGVILPEDDSPKSRTASTSFAITASNSGRFPLDDTPQSVTGSAAITFTVPSFYGQLVSSGIGSASFSISTNTPTLTSPMYGTGETSIQFTSSALLGAEAGISGGTSFSILSQASILPLDDTSPLRSAEATFTINGSAVALPDDDAPPTRTASATISFSGFLIPYAIGMMSGSTVAGESGLSPADIASVAEASAEKVWRYER